jgi:general bacterial porin, GBP family
VAKYHLLDLGQIKLSFVVFGDLRMKKSLLALAALSAFATAAQAQSSVTVYGIVDIGFTSQDTAGVSGTAMTDNTLATSRLGFRGTEDLGGGLKAEFQLESKLAPSNGMVGADTPNATQTNVMFNRESWVGLSSTKFGSLRLGLTDVTDAVNIDAKVSQAAELALINELGTDKKKTVRYTTPNFAGFSAQVGYSNAVATPALEATSGAAAPTTAPATSVGAANTGRTTGMYAAYEAGKLGLYAGVEEAAAVAAEPTRDQKHTVFGAKYDFGFASFGVSQGKKDQAAAALQGTNGDLTQTRVSVAAPVAALGSGVKAHAVYLEDKSDTKVAADYTQYTLALTKAMSKRTTGYVAYQDKDFELTGTDTKSYTVGIVHTF